MNCEMAQQAIALAHGQIDAPQASEGESDPAAGKFRHELRHDLHAHIESCPACREELAFYQALAAAIDETPLPEPSPTLVARARARLDSELDTRPAPGAFSRLLLNLSFGLGRLRAAPVLASSLIVLGLLAGAYVGYQAGSRAHSEEQSIVILPPSAADPDDAPKRIAAVTAITRGADAESVEVHYDRLVADSLPGSLDDPAIRTLLLLGAQNTEDASVRSDAVALLAHECRNGHQCAESDDSKSPRGPEHQPVLSTLLASLRSDREPQVRISALHGLEPYIARDVRVRNAVLETLMSDSDIGVRNEAVRMLPPVQVDSSVREVLHTVANRDHDAGLRSASQQLLDSTPQVQ